MKRKILNENIKISCIIPVYNVEKYVERCLKSIISQSLREIEIIVVHDASQDCSLDIIKKYQTEDSRIVLINKERNEGLSAARNSGLRIAKGEYILHIDSDDWVEQGYFQAMYQKGKCTNVDIVISDYYREDSDGRVTYIHDYSNLSFNKVKNIELLEAIFLAKGSANVWNKLIRKELYDKYKIRFLPEVSLGEDLAVIPKLFYYANGIQKIDKAYLHYIQNPRSITQTNNYKKIFDIYYVLKDLEQFFKHEVLSIDILKTNELSSCLFNNTCHFEDSDYAKIVEEYLTLIQKIDVRKIQKREIEILAKLFQWKIFNNRVSFRLIWKIINTFLRKGR